MTALADLVKLLAGYGLVIQKKTLPNGITLTTVYLAPRPGKRV